MRNAYQMLDNLSASGIKWCLCFGALLSFVREKKMPSSDIDVGILHGHKDALDYLRSSYPLDHLVVDDCTGAPLNAAFKTPFGVLDVFFWMVKGGNAYHCYDELNERPRTGKLSRYCFKGVPQTIFYPTAEDIAQVPAQCFMDRRIDCDDPQVNPICSGDRTYIMSAPGFEADGLQVRLPFGFGQALDLWYPGLWMVKDSQYGVSKSATEFIVKSCKGAGLREATIQGSGR